MPRRSCQGDRNCSERGYALPLALVLVLVAGTLVASAMYLMQSSLRAARNMQESAEANALADAAVYEAIARRLANPTDLSASFEELPSSPGFPTAQISVETIVERGKIDLSRAPSGASAVVLEALGLPLEVTRQIIGQFALAQQAHGMQGTTGRVVNLTIGDLRPFTGLNVGLYGRLRGAFTVYTRRPKINLASASPELRSVLSRISPDIASELVESSAASGQRLSSDQEQTTLVGPLSVHAVVRFPSGTEAERYVVILAAAQERESIQILYWE